MMTKYKFACFPMHPPRQTQMMKNSHEFYVVEEGTKKWINEINIQTGANARPLPKNATIINRSEFNEMLDREVFDSILLQTPEHIREFKSVKYHKTYLWHQVLDIPKDVLECVGTRPLGIAASNNYILRKQDSVIPHGFDIKDYIQRDFNKNYNKYYLYPINGFRKHRNVIDGNLTGYGWVDVIEQMSVVVCGINPEYSRTKHFSFEKYKKELSKATGIFMPCPAKHRSNSMGDAMCSGNLIITRPPLKFRNQFSLLTHNHDCIIVSTKEQAIKTLKNMLDDKKEQQRLGENALMTVIEKWNIDTAVNKWENFFELSLS